MNKSVCEIRHDSHTFTSPMKDFESWKANAMERLKRPNAGRVNGQVLEFNPVRTRSDYARWYAWYRICMIEQRILCGSEYGRANPPRLLCTSDESREDHNEHVQ